MNKRYAGWFMVFSGAAGLLVGPAIIGILRREAMYLGLIDGVPGDGTVLLMVLCCLLTMGGALGATASYFDL